jgi:NADH:ubiquinone oxidoreductase subunit E
VVAPPETTANVTFDKTMDDRIGEVMRRYPTRRAALLPVLWLCQERFGWISPGVISAVAERLGDSPAFVDGVVDANSSNTSRPSSASASARRPPTDRSSWWACSAWAPAATPR